MKRSQKHKITSSHTSHIDVAKPLISFAQNEDLVYKISLGIIKQVSKPSPKRVKITTEQACLCLKIRGNKYIQEIRLYTENILELDKIIKAEAREIGFIF